MYTLTWTQDELVMNVGVDDDASPTPIPSVALLIGTAFSGLFMFRRQVFKG